MPSYRENSGLATLKLHNLRVDLDADRFPINCCTKNDLADSSCSEAIETTTVNTVG